jgi:GTP 3',8-cyclase
VVQDQLGRPLRSLRLSVTDRCNLRCQYCMPELEYTWLPREDLLTFEELARVAELFVSLGVDRIRLTGGEPLLRRDLPSLVGRLAVLPGLADLAMTTNGVHLAAHAWALKDAGLTRVTVSLDTLRPETFARLTRVDQHAAVLDGIHAAARIFGALKLDTVVLRGINDEEIVPLVEFSRRVGAEIRFIEYMDVAGATNWSREGVVTRHDILRRLSLHYGPIDPIGEVSSAPAERYRLPDGTIFGVIASTSEPFCARCDRGRLTADGLFYLCLYATRGMDLRRPLRAGASDDDLRELIRSIWTARRDRGAEDRLTLADRQAFISRAALKRDAHLEMHTKGG